ncbi:MAG: hypothetical protein KBA70_09200 [Aquabacterium sp.]|jgi:HD-GYP domain-containing protein (c-di-GMP phosphodiesterase class II)|uniref:HD-GYP domain-containing protein n=1 Tax=Aquabacterium sp. TaxID=1872578 RepID=UPI001B5C275B|nr:HD domain-containing phosphohydrolase [Aquabacterium sp.]MBP7132925.1 hypothetical protein [Aquabacterium sp.]MDQ5925302.1 hypothetical protein [Pseudomonadota bacterium]
MSEKPKDPFALWSSILKRTGMLLRQHKENPRFAQDLSELAGMVYWAMQQHQEIGTFEMMHGEATGYAIAHSLQTAFVASLAAGRLGWSESDRITLIRASLTMNIAMLDLQNTLSLQTTPLTAKQRAEIDTHPQRGREILEAANVTCQDWLCTVAQHHVTLDGRNVPQDRNDLSQLACMVHYADVYLARISPRASRVAQPVNIAARELFMKAGGADNPYAAAIIKEMGLYPPGSFVKLANGDTAVVLRKGETAVTPQVHSLISADGWVFPDSKLRDTAKVEFRVMASVPRGEVMLSLNRAKLFGYTTA